MLDCYWLPENAFIDIYFPFFFRSIYFQNKILKTEFYTHSTVASNVSYVTIDLSLFLFPPCVGWSCFHYIM